MHLDVSRDSFNKGNHLLRVVQQQGGVMLDADANEQTAILLHRLHTLAGDLFGPFWGPADGLGFAITFDAAAKKCMVGPGRYYVGGRLVENDVAVAMDKQEQYPIVLKEDELKQAFLVYLDVWERVISEAESLPLLRDPALDGLTASPRTQMVWQVKFVAPFPNLNATADDMTNANKELRDANSNNASDNLKTRLGVTAAKATLTARAYLDSDDESVTRYEGLENQLYRVEVHRPGLALGSAGAAMETCATFKWSRDNGSVVFPVVADSLQAGWTMNPDGTFDVPLVHLGCDERTSLQPDDWIEYRDNISVLAADRLPEKATSKYLFQVVKTSTDAGSMVTLRKPDDVPALEPSALRRWAYLRRWDHAGAPLDGKSVPGNGIPTQAQDGALFVVAPADVAADWLDLEDGIQIQFAKDQKYKAGDYWLIPARTNSRDILWPKNAVEASNAHHCYAPLAIVNPADAAPVDCRRTFKTSLTDLL